MVSYSVDTSKEKNRYTGLGLHRFRWWASIFARGRSRIVGHRIERAVNVPNFYKATYPTSKWHGHGAECVRNRLRMLESISSARYTRRPRIPRRPQHEDDLPNVHADRTLLQLAILNAVKDAIGAMGSVQPDNTCLRLATDLKGIRPSRFLSRISCQ